MLKAVLRCIGGAFLALILLCVCNQASANNSSNMSASILVGDGVEITLIGDNPLVLDLNPNTKQHEAKSIKLKVATSNAAGYKLTMSAEGDITDLRKDDRTATIPTLGTGESYASVDNFPANRWGYKQDSGSFIPFEPTELLNNDSPTSGDITELTFGSKVDYSQAPGSYSIKITFLATANVVLQDIQNIDPTLCTSTPLEVQDSRDGQAYTIQRLLDGKCWMMNNLNLGATNSLNVNQLDSTNTNLTGDNASKTISADVFLDTTSESGWKKSKLSRDDIYTTPEYIPITTENSTDGLDEDQTSKTWYGTLYNFCAASAQTICTDSNTSNATSDLCPAGWRLSTGSHSGEFGGLYEMYTNHTIRYPIYEGGAAFALAGYANSTNGEPVWQGREGRYWSSTRYNGYSMYTLFLNSNNSVVVGATENHYNALSMRCVLKEDSPTPQVTYMQDMTLDQCTTTPMTVVDKRDGEEYTVRQLADGNCWLLDNLRLDPTKVSLDDLKGNTNATDQILTYFKNGGGSSPYSANGVVDKTSSGGSWENSYDRPYVAAEHKDTIQQASGDFPAGKLGVYYNYCAASAGSYCYAAGVSSGNAQYDICPARWRMPTIDSYKNLYYKYSPRSDSFAALNTPLSGYYFGEMGETGSFWSSSRSDGYMMMYWRVSSISGAHANEANSNSRADGRSVRCILK